MSIFIDFYIYTFINIFFHIFLEILLKLNIEYNTCEAYSAERQFTEEEKVQTSTGN